MWRSRNKLCVFCFYGGRGGRDFDTEMSVINPNKEIHD